MNADNADFYCHNQVPFVMGTTGGDRHKLLQNTKDAGAYAVIAPQMGKQVSKHADSIPVCSVICMQGEVLCNLLHRYTTGTMLSRENAFALSASLLNDTLRAFAVLCSP